MASIAEKNLLTLMAACIKEDSILGKIVLHRISSGDDYRYLKNLGQYSCFTEEGFSLLGRIQHINLPETASYHEACKLEYNVTQMAREFKELSARSDQAARSAFSSGYQPISIILSDELDKILNQKRESLKQQPVYAAWLKRGDYVYLTDEARQLKREMDAFSAEAGSLQEVYQRYQTLQNFQQRFQNTQGIVTREKHQAEQAEKNKKAFKNIAIAIGVIVAIALVATYWSDIVKFFKTVLTWVGVCIVLGIIGQFFGGDD